MTGGSFSAKQSFITTILWDTCVVDQFTDWSTVYGFNMTPMAQRAMEIRMQKGQPEVMQLEEASLLSNPVTVGDTLDLRWVQRILPLVRRRRRRRVDAQAGRT